MSAKRFGGKPEDYHAIHDWFDETKKYFCDARHRALRHHSQGIFEAESVFGHSIVNSDGKEVPVRYIGEWHVKEDCGGFVPTISDWLSNMRVRGWMNKSYSSDERLIPQKVREEKND